MMYKINVNVTIISMYISLFVFTIFCFSCSKSTTKLENTTISFKKEFHDFGEIAQKKEVSTTFIFSNRGEEPLFIQAVKSTCGCTVPEYSKEMIKPSDKGEIKVVYDAKLPGRFNKTITVYFNGKDSPKTLTIKGEVPYPKDTDSIINE